MGLRVWLAATRPKTLSASIAPVLLGTALGAHVAGSWSWLAMAACLLGALLIQIGSNFANDAFDAQRGADNDQRLGPQRAVASGAITGRSMLIATAVVLLLALIPGLYLASIAGPWLLVMGIIALICAVIYTGGPYPLAYHGLGDVFVLIFFGYFAVIGAAWVQAPDLATVGNDLAAPWLSAPWLSWPWLSSPWLFWPWQWWTAASALGLQAVVIIAVNNQRDVVGDAAVGKRTLAVRLGPRAHRGYIAMLHVAALIAVALTCGGGWPTAVAALGGVLHTIYVLRHEGRALNPALGMAALLELLTAGALVAWLYDWPSL